MGKAAVEIGKAMGARVIAAASSAEKLAVAQRAGADELINYSEANLKEELKRLTKGQGVDVVYDPVGGELAEQALRSMAWDGRYLVVGFASGTIPSFAANLTLLKGCQIVGVFWGHLRNGHPRKIWPISGSCWDGRSQVKLILQLPESTLLKTRLRPSPIWVDGVCLVRRWCG